MFLPTVSSNMFDSVLALPNGNDLAQNAWLTLQLRVKFNFCDSTNPLADRMVKQGGRWFATDGDKYLFPMLDWTADLRTKFMRGVVKRAEDTWNYQFLLITPSNCSLLDVYGDFRAQTLLKMRPNVLCLFRLAVIGPDGLLDNTPAAGPLRTGAPHRTISVFNLDKSVRKVSLAPGVAPTDKHPAQQNVGRLVDGTFRSDDYHYDDSDLDRPSVIDSKNHVNHNTIGHEIGHALGQPHIRGLMGDATCAIDADDRNDKKCYGVFMDSWNIMGRGDRVYLVNAISWRDRIAVHTGVPSSAWAPTGVMATPPRSRPAAIVEAGSSFGVEYW